MTIADKIAALPPMPKHEHYDFDGEGYFDALQEKRMGRAHVLRDVAEKVAAMSN